MRIKKKAFWPARERPPQRDATPPPLPPPLAENALSEIVGVFFDHAFDGLAKVEVVERMIEDAH